jgi:hypothetical protein
MVQDYLYVYSCGITAYYVRNSQSTPTQHNNKIKKKKKLKQYPPSHLEAAEKSKACWEEESIAVTITCTAPSPNRPKKVRALTNVATSTTSFGDQHHQDRTRRKGTSTRCPTKWNLSSPFEAAKKGKAR